MDPSNLPEKAVFRTMLRLVLASASPRRADLLKSMGLTFRTVVSGVEETNHADVAPSELVRHWAREKARCVAAKFPDHWVLAADTVVSLGGVSFGKPQDARHASLMLKTLSNTEHEVISAVCLVHQSTGYCRIESVLTRVLFKSLTDAEIDAYVATREPMDKAGGYGIQGMGAFLVRSIVGSYTNVVGLPLCETLDLLMAQGIIVPR